VPSTPRIRIGGARASAGRQCERSADLARPFHDRHHHAVRDAEHDDDRVTWRTNETRRENIATVLL
jgi:hypothetical protein